MSNSCLEWKESTGGTSILTGPTTSTGSQHFGRLYRTILSSKTLPNIGSSKCLPCIQRFAVKASAQCCCPGAWPKLHAISCRSLLLRHLTVCTSTRVMALRNVVVSTSKMAISLGLRCYGIRARSPAEEAHPCIFRSFSVPGQISQWRSVLLPFAVNIAKATRTCDHQLFLCS